ncbi:nucleoside monophosphate kinase [Patescibacteria group bacterium]|nr:nucleoside monophosphate kinase [Patescibacteria group bacterium]
MGKIICLYGLPACGKTTQAELIKNEFGFIQFGMGDRLREEIASGSELGQKIKTFVDEGILITDDLMAEVIKNVSSRIKENGIIFDGFPRMISQAKMLERIGAELGEEIYKFFYLKVSPEEALRRIAARAELTGRADDKDEDAVKNRLGVFERESKILLDYYGQSGKLVEINGELSIEEVFNEIKNNL